MAKKIQHLSASLALLLAGSGGCHGLSIPGCPSDTVVIGELCRPGCTQSSDCLGGERCDSVLGACIAEGEEAPEIVAFTVSPEVVGSPGERVSLHYEVRAASAVEILPGVLARTGELSGSVEVEVADTTTFELKAYAGDREVSARRIVALRGGRAVVVSFTASPERASPGARIELAWDVENARGGSVRVTDPENHRVVTDGVGARGTEQVEPVSLPVSYWLEATGETGELVRAEVQVLLAGDGKPKVRELQIIPARISPLDTALVAWTTEGGASLTLAQNGTEILATSDPKAIARGFRLVDPLAPSTYALSVANGQGDVDQRAEILDVAVVRAPTILEAGIDPDHRAAPTGATQISVSWNVADASRVTLAAGRSPATEVDSSGRTGDVAGPVNYQATLVAEDRGSVAALRLMSWYLLEENEPNDVAEQADRADAMARSGVLAPVRTDADMFAFDVPAQGAVSVMLGSYGGSPASCSTFSSSLRLELRSSGGGTVAMGEIDGTTGCPVARARSLAEGTYYARVTAEGASWREWIDYGIFVDATGPACGDGATEGSEECDDANRKAGDGCDGFCVSEPAAVYAAEVRDGNATALPPTVQPVVFGPAASGADPLDDGVAIVALPFPFEFYGRTYAGLIVHTDGYLAFRPEAAAGGPAQAIPSEAQPNAVIAPFWADLALARFAGASGEVLTWTREAGNGRRRFEIAFRNLTGKVHVESSHALLDAIVSLEEGTNTVRIEYGATRTVGDAAELSLVAGIEDERGRAGVAVPGCAPACGASTVPSGKLITFTRLER